jgi:hypothetical protein
MSLTKVPREEQNLKISIDKGISAGHVAGTASAAS